MATIRSVGKTLKVKFNFDTILETDTVQQNVRGQKIHVQDFHLSKVARKGEIHDIDEELAEKFLAEAPTYVPVGSGKALQRVTLDDFMPDVYVPRIVLVD